VIFGIVVLAISISLARGQEVGSAPATTVYDAFTGGLAILACPLGMTALGVTFLVPFSLAVDGLVAVTSLAGGIATALGLRGADCSDPNTLFYNNLLNGGLFNFQGRLSSALTKQQMQSRCNADKADTAFMFLGFVVSVVLLALSFHSYRRTK
jgi:hypothetical protein